METYTEEGFAHMQRAVPRVLEVFKHALQRPRLRVVFGTDAVAGAFGKQGEELIYRLQIGGQTTHAPNLSPPPPPRPPPPFAGQQRGPPPGRPAAPCAVDR